MTISGAMFVDAHKNFLREILGKLRISDKTLQVRVNAALIARRELFKRKNVVRLRGKHKTRLFVDSERGCVERIFDSHRKFLVIDVGAVR